jgi:hypothetical protein
MPVGVYPRKQETRQELLHRFEKFISMEPTTGCWLWTGADTRGGYGAFRLRPKTVRAPRMAWTLYKGPIPDGLEPCHCCDTPACCSPYHLFLGTQMENVHDCMSKGRDRKAKGKDSSAVKHSKLTEEQVIAIAADTRLLHVIALEYGITKQYAWQIRKRKTWKHLLSSEDPNTH